MDRWRGDGRGCWRGRGGSLISVRFGLRLRLPLGLFPNAGLFVGQIRENSFDDVEESVDLLRAALVFAGRPEWAELLVFERR